MAVPGGQPGGGGEEQPPTHNPEVWRLIFAIAKRVSAIPVERGAETLVYVASARELDGTSGKYFDKCRERAPDASAQDDGAAKRLWDESEQLIGFRLD